MMKYQKLLLHINKFCILSYFSGIALFIFFNHEDQSEHCYFSENALLPGLVQLEHFSKEKDISYFSERCHNKSNKSIEDMKILLQEVGVEAYEQNFQFQNDFVMSKEMLNGTNVYGVIRASRSSSTECIVINIPMVEDEINYASGVAIAFGQLARNEIFWAKDIILLFSQHGSHGVRAWLDVYHGMTSSYIKASQLPARAGSIQAAVILELPAKEVSYINLKLEGRNGQLPNLDLVNLVVKLSQNGRIPVSINHQFSPYFSSKIENLEQYLTSSVNMMKQLATGKSSGNHGEFLIYNAPALTIQGVHNRRWVGSNLVGMEILLNGICRSLNNLLERFHQSFFFYFLPSIDRYISISMFMPCFGLVLVPAIAKALSILLAMNQEALKETSSQQGDENEVLEKLLDESGSNFANVPSVSDTSPVWYEVLVMVAASYLCGIMLFYSPYFTSVWSEMYALPPQTCFVLLQIFVCILSAGFVLSFPISNKAAAYLRVTALLLMSIVLGVLSIINFSFGYLSSIFMVPPSLLVTHQPGKLYYLNKLLVLLASPISACLLMFRSSEDFVDVYNWHATSHSMFFSVFTLLFFPLWLQIWCVCSSSFELKKEAKETKPKNA